MLTGGQDSPPCRFLQDDRFSSRLLSKAKYGSSKQGGEASFRVLYYGGATGSVPFVWESQPGTPKHTSNHNPLPPLTPPPSYQSIPRTNPLRKKHSKNSKFLNSIFPRVVPSKKFNTFSPPQSSSSSFSSSYSLSSTPFNVPGIHNTNNNTNSPTSTLCFGGPARKGSPWRRSRVYSSYPIKSVMKVVLSIVGHGKGNY